MKVALNPLQWYELDQSGMGLVDVRPYPEILERLHAAGFKAVPADPELTEGDVQSLRHLLDRLGLKPAPGYHSAPLSSGTFDASDGEAALSFAIKQRELGMTEACLADGAIADRIADPMNPVEPTDRELAGTIAATVEISRLWNGVGLTPCIHNHVGTGIQTEMEIDALLHDTDPAEVGFCPDTGHLAWAGVGPAELIARHRERIPVAHVKDLSAAVLGEALSGSWDYIRTVKTGLWREPGHGDVDLAACMEALAEVSWLIIEVDQSMVGPTESTDRCSSWAEDQLKGLS